MNRVCRAIALAGSAAVLALAGCGVKGPPLPPREIKPERITSLKALPDKDGIRLTWPRPDNYAGGHPMRDLAGFAVMRAQGSASMTRVAELPITDRERFQKMDRFEWVDAATVTGSTYRYQVVSTTIDGYRSDPSNEVAFTRVAPPSPPNPENFALPRPSPLP